MRALAATKTMFHQAMCVHRTLLSSLKEDPSWACLSAQSTLDELDRLLRATECAASNEFAQDILNSDIADVRLKNKGDPEAFFHKVRMLNDSLNPAVKAMNSAHARLHRMHRASRP